MKRSLSPKAILHVDGDSFFASCEIATNPALRGKPVITGKERGIVSSMTYDVKARGVKRGMPLAQAARIMPEAVIVSSDYETYSLFSKRMYAIVRRYTDAVEEYSIDECFADLTGMEGPLRMSYEQMAAAIKFDLESELGMTFSVGLGPNKVIAKIASKWRKPAGLTIIPAHRIAAYLRNLPVSKLWGIGPQTTTKLEKLGVTTALEFATKSDRWISAHMAKPAEIIWRELNGEMVQKLNLENKHDYQSISKTRTFTPTSSDKAFVFAQLSKNIENACIKARRHGLAAKKFFFFLKTQEFRYAGLEVTLSLATALPTEIIRLVEENIDEVYRSGTPYRATGVVLMDLIPEANTQADLFGATVEFQKWRRVYAAVDALDDKFGKHTVFLASTSRALEEPEQTPAYEHTNPSPSFSTLLNGKHLTLPSLGSVA